ncbi:MBL fold metallo-hydrolase [Flavobacterium agricola]|uniref:MBL fold metallo-hydrolase n=1 Tax=Flavobacterium agricola TaxID=2870839 RepID=A0ABY6M1C5_9FLAO|nr:MBL fold metallo-hydrolase [Flavobacterium agricola]UYW00921.1 MBL fold metallo-hydrolase [Flavobacterium agricola]
MWYLFLLIALLLLGAYLYTLQPKFGKNPSGARLEKIKQSQFYANGAFQNLSHTPALAEGHTTFQVFWNFFFKKHPNTIPDQEIPHVVTDLKTIPANENVLVWFGHSSYFIQLHGKKYLIDPVFSGNVSPIPNTAKAFNGSDYYKAANMPEIDYLILTHDHYDHLDYETLVALKDKVKQVICPLGVGSHLEHWGYDAERLIEKEWYESEVLDKNLKISFMPTRHFSGRSLKRNNTLWTSYVLESEDFKLYIGGDSGYDSHFKAIGEQFGPFDFALLENGQYNKAWRYIHLFPEELLQAAKDLKAKRIMPVHSSKFKLAHHEWDTPLKDLVQKNDSLNLATPKIGEVVYLNENNQVFEPWWNSYK